MYGRWDEVGKGSEDRLSSRDRRSLPPGESLINCREFVHACLEVPPRPGLMSIDFDCAICVAPGALDEAAPPSQVILRECDLGASSEKYESTSLASLPTKRVETSGPVSFGGKRTVCLTLGSGSH